MSVNPCIEVLLEEQMSHGIKKAQLSLKPLAVIQQYSSPVVTDIFE